MWQMFLFRRDENFLSGTREIILAHFVFCFHFHPDFAQRRRISCIFGHILFWKKVLNILKSVIWLPSWET